MQDYFDVKFDRQQLMNLSNLGLAYVGDAVYELLVRVKLCSGISDAGRLHTAALQYVAAPKQAAFAEKLLPLLTPEERDVFRRGRNTKVNGIPQKATPDEYHRATGLEALFGYLYLCGEKDRINELFDRMTDTEGEA